MHRRAISLRPHSGEAPPRGVSQSEADLERRVEERTAELATALEKSEARFRALMENSIDVTLIVDSDLRLQYVSPSVTRVLGYAPDELTGPAPPHFIHPDDAHRVIELVEHAMHEPSLMEANEFRVRHKDGSWRIMDAVGLNLLHDPTVAGMVVTARDITARR